MIDAHRIFNISNDTDFEQLALDVFKFQFENNAVYRSFCDLLYKHPADITTIQDIPFLPIQFFKSHQVLSSSKPIIETFTSSGTTGNITSKHYVTDISLYEKSFTEGFKLAYGSIKDYAILALLPSYLERDGSSLVYMVNHLITASAHPKSGFYLNTYKELAHTITQLEKQGQKTLLIGVSFALLDFIESFQFELEHTIIMETGGMKGRRKEMIRPELHQILKTGFGVSEIHSEYGMTELISQAYSKGEGVFIAPPWLKIYTRETEDALTLHQKPRSGGINIIDLANVNSCSFIATQDLGKAHNSSSFEITGRFDHSDIRGCNLMIM